MNLYNVTHNVSYLHYDLEKSPVLLTSPVIPTKGTVGNLLYYSTSEHKWRIDCEESQKERLLLGNKLRRFFFQSSSITS